MSANAKSDSRFLELIAENRARILKICQVYAWGREDQDDLYQEALCQIWRALPTLRQDAHANTWVYRIVLNTAISFVRKQKAQRAALVSDGDKKIREMVDSGSGQDPETAERLSKLFEAISRLNAMEKGIITLFLEDLSYRQIAEVMGMTESNVGVVLHRAKTKLATRMKEAPCRTKP